MGAVGRYLNRSFGFVVVLTISNFTFALSETQTAVFDTILLSLESKPTDSSKQTITDYLDQLLSAKKTERNSDFKQS